MFVFMIKEEVLQELLDRLAAMGIEPLGAIETIPSLVEKRVWRAEAAVQHDILPSHSANA